jgi:hypothetical protein
MKKMVNDFMFPYAYKCKGKRTATTIFFSERRSEIRERKFAPVLKYE